MWFVYTILTFFAWGIADLFYKKGNDEKDEYSHIKTGILVGFVMGIHAFVYWTSNRLDVSIIEIVKYFPVSFCYIASMVIGYKGLKYINLSISSPIQNSSGIIDALLLCIIFKVALERGQILGIILLAIGVVFLSFLEYHYDKENRHNLIKKWSVQAVVFPIIYCIFDGLGTFLDAVYLDHLELIGEDAALISYEITFLAYGSICLLYLKLFKKTSIKLSKDKTKLFAAVFETAGQYTYVNALLGQSEIAIPVISCYSALSVLLSRIFLKEKITKLQFLAILIIFAGILVLGLSEAGII